MPEKEIENLSYEEAVLALENIINELESGNTSLDKSIELYTKGSLLKLHCEKQLELAEEKISEITKNQEDGSFSVKQMK